MVAASSSPKKTYIVTIGKIRQGNLGANCSQGTESGLDGSRLDGTSSNREHFV